ncbi:hypothetical protein [Gilvimarinus sp. DA14]|uniref:helix-turn-helix transcriptional regulator n=1 Tax=Gilvimarinus sp. DA14 TaxID=2956798 RepID=UPI0020B7E473|nr:hypothetical protein [Gilvimarinus sp. DA14]UTF61449.1 hypothetical protein NHM04_06535 [Gilvimarinus sp. DA14]
MDMQCSHSNLREQAIELIYSTAFDASAWKSFMALIKKELRYELANVTLVNNQSLKPISRQHHNNPSEYESLYLKHFHSRDIWYKALQERSKEGVFTPSHRVVTPENYKKSEFYNDFLKRYQINNAIGGYWQWQDDISARVSFLRSDAAGPISEAEEYFFNSLSRHIKHALRLQHSNFASSQTENGSCAAIITTDLTLLHYTDSFMQLLDDGGLSAGFSHRLCFKDRSSQENLAATLRTMDLPGAPDSATVPIIINGSIAVLVHISPLYLSACTSRGQRTFLLNLSTAGLFKTEIPIQQKLGLTDAEFAICKDLAQGACIKSITAKRCRSEHTIRKQVKDIQSKLSVSTQAGVVAKYYQLLLNS